MKPSEFQDEVNKNDQEKKSEEDKVNLTGAINKAGIKNVEATNASAQSTAKALKTVKGEVKVTNPDLAKSKDVAGVVDSINKLNLTTFMSNEGLPQLAENLSKLGDNVQSLQDKYANEGLKQLSDQLGNVVSQLKDVSKTLNSTKIQVDSGLQKTIDGLKKSIDGIDFKPSVNVSAPETKVITTPVDLKPIVTALTQVENAIKDSQPDKEEIDLSPIVIGLQSVQEAISNQTFPVPNYVLPFKDANGKATQVQLDASGNLPTTGGSGGGGTQYTELVTTAPAIGTVALGRYKLSAPTLTDGQLYAPQLDASGNLKVNVAAGGASGGTSSSFGSAFPATGTAVGAKDSTGTNLAALNLDASGFLKVNVAAGGASGGTSSTFGAAVPGTGTAAGFSDGTNMQLGKAYDLDSGAGVDYVVGSSLRFLASGGSTPADTNSGSKSAATLRVVLATDQPQLTNKLLVTPDSVALPANQSVNVSQINAVTPLMGNGVTGTGSQRVTIASDNTAFSVNATLSAETTKVIGTVNQGTSPWVTSLTSTTLTSVVPGTGATNLGKAEDAASASGDVGVGALVLQQASPGDNAGTDGDYSFLQMSAGRLWASAKIDTALPAGTNVIGHVITDTGSTTAVTGTVTVSGTVTTTPPSNASTNIAQINGVTPLMGNGVTGTGSQRVTIASDNTAFSVNAIQSGTWNIGTVTTVSAVTAITNALPVGANVIGKVSIDQTTPGTTNLVSLTAETTKVIGVVRNADGSGNLLTSTANALDINIKSGSIANTSFAATQATAANLNATVVQGTAAALSSPWPTYNGEISDFTGTFTNATQTTSVTATGLDGYGNILISIQGTYGTATAVFEGSDDSGTTWFAVDAAQTSGSTIEGGYTSLTNITRSWQINVPGFDSVRVRSTAVASGTVNVRMSASAALGADAAAVSIAGTVIVDDLAAAPTGSTVPANAQYEGALAQNALPTAGTPGNLVGELADKFGRPVVLPNAFRDIMGTQTTTITSSTAETTIITSIASTFLDLVSIFISNTSVTAARVDIRDATAGTVIFQLYIPAGDMRGISLTTPWPQTTVANNWTAQSSASVADLRVSALYIKNK